MIENSKSNNEISLRWHRTLGKRFVELEGETSDAL